MVVTSISFGYISPNDYELYGIRQLGPEILRAMTDYKQQAPGLKVWIALGGWTFNDDGEDTQPVFGDLSSTHNKRQKFLDNLVKFMIEYGFDGVDFDWEYPGADDRGGHPEDAQNYVELLKETRDRFQSLRRGWGISFTAPSSYWYLQHFDIEHMMVCLTHTSYN